MEVSQARKLGFDAVIEQFALRKASAALLGSSFMNDCIMFGFFFFFNMDA